MLVTGLHSWSPRQDVLSQEGSGMSRLGLFLKGDKREGGIRPGWGLVGRMFV